ncbi:MAG: hypothetical protein MUP98_09960 [Candidatus Aminicenantes bacterium]|nr:hypothetical protein [Candidatus Aminicenantes bacterium]
MSKDLILGSVIICLSLGTILTFVLWGRKTIERIKKKNQKSAREIIQDIDGRR